MLQLSPFDTCPQAVDSNTLAVVSIESCDKPGSFLIVANNALALRQNAETASFNRAASFWLRENAFNVDSSEQEAGARTGYTSFESYTNKQRFLVHSLNHGREQVWSDLCLLLTSCQDPTEGA